MVIILSTPTPQDITTQRMGVSLSTPTPQEAPTQQLGIVLSAPIPQEATTQQLGMVLVIVVPVSLYKILLLVQKLAIMALLHIHITQL